MKKIGVFIIAVMLTVVAVTARAEIQPGIYSLTPYVGYYKFEGNEGLKDTYCVGLRLSYNASENLGMESFFSLTPTQIDEADGDNVRMWSYGIEGVYNFMPDKRLVPFVAVGISGIYYDTVGFTNDYTNKFAIEYGGGLKYFITDNVALRADVRHVIPVSETYNDFLFAFGVSYAFGTSKKSTASAPEETYVPPPAAPAEVEAPPAAAPTQSVAVPKAEEKPVEPVVSKETAPAVTETQASAPAPVAVATVITERTASNEIIQTEEKPSAEEDIKKLINKWRNAWQSGDMEAYRSCYAPKFNAKGKNLDQWVSYKAKLQKRSKNINISVDDLIITLNDADIATAVFVQNYSSSILKDSGEKILRLVKINNEWKISEEMM